MKKISVLALAFLLIVSLISPAAKVDAAGFKDVNSKYWAKDEIHYLANLNIINGYTNGKFGVNDPVKRSHVAVILYRALELDSADVPDPGFKDVPVTHPAYKEIATCVAYGLFDQAEYFKPEKSMTRAQMAKVFADSFELVPAMAVPFKDVKKSDWFYQPVQALANYNITVGSDGYFKPNKPLTRAEFSVFLARIMEPTFRPGVNAVIESASYKANGNLVANLVIYNNTNHYITELNSRFTLYAESEEIASHAFTKENPYPLKFKSFGLAPKGEKSITVEFKPNEITKKVELTEDTMLEVLFLYEYYYK
ncbi:S-layer homology domain-containing protein [Cytobacillus massiliigabonensis]|uniref:S-layer homology domain-containing protein n=1 Tax=Cytobacillus massiliigabonensis TaxID=1871011 RepID=UPI000C83D3CB|nr:S-layer homology domain-containing protein [Cytobacillus massiliigabonensis]